MRQRSTASGEHEIPGRVFEDGAVTDLQNVLQIRFVAAGTGFREAHITDAPRHFDQMLASDFGIRLPADAVIREIAIDNRIIDDLATDQINSRLTDNADILSRVETTHGGRS